MNQITCNNCGSSNLGRARYCQQCGKELPKQVEEKIVELTPVETTPKKWNKNTVLGYFVGVILFFGIAWAIENKFLNQGTIDAEMMKIANEVNKSCPFMIDRETRLDNMMTLPNNKIVYNYTLINMELESVDTFAMRDYLGPQILNQAKTNLQLKYQRDHKTTLLYAYKDKNGKHLIDVVVNPEDY